MRHGVLLSILALTLVTRPARAQEPPAAESPAAEPATPAATPTVTAAPARPLRFDIAPRMGVLIPTSAFGASVHGGLELGYVLPVLDGRLIVALDLGVAQPSASASTVDTRLPDPGRLYGITVTETEVTLGLHAIYRIFGEDRALVPYAGIGPVLYLLSVREENDFDAGSSNTEQATEVGLTFFGGADYRLGPGRVFGELRILYAAADHQLTGDVNLGNFVMSVGYRFLF